MVETVVSAQDSNDHSTVPEKSVLGWAGSGSDSDSGFDSGFDSGSGSDSDSGSGSALEIVEHLGHWIPEVDSAAIAHGSRNFLR